MQPNSAGCGLQNLGNTCFFNATLQSLLHAPPLANLLHLHRHSERCQRKHQWCVFCEMERIYTSTHQGRIFSPTNMLKNLSKIFKKFKLGRQEDSHQFLRYLVEGMQESETGKVQKLTEHDEKKIKKSLVFQVFGGMIKTVVECLNCSRTSTTGQRYYDLNIECQRANSLQEGIAGFFAVDKLEGSNKYLCEHCKVRSNARKRSLLETVPQVATFQLKRFTNSMRKIGKFFPYPLEVDMGKYLEKPSKVLMKLFAIVVHLGGSSFSGHYYAFVRVGTTWYKMDDSYVSKCSPQTVMNQQAYLLFYEREEQPKEVMKKNVEQLKINGVEKVVHGNGVKSVMKQEKKIQQKPLTNGVGNHVIQKVEVKLREQEKKQVKKVQGVSEQLLHQIQSKLVSKLGQSDVFKKLEQSKGLVSDAISKAVKQTICEVTPIKNEHQSKANMILDEDIDIELPGLKRTKSKEQMQRQIPIGDLILRTYDRILQLRSKIPLKMPHNPSRRNIYNLRKYETNFQKKRKLG